MGFRVELLNYFRMHVKWDRISGTFNSILSWTGYLTIDCVRSRVNLMHPWVIKSLASYSNIMKFKIYCGGECINIASIKVNQISSVVYICILYIWVEMAKALNITVLKNINLSHIFNDLHFVWTSFSYLILTKVPKRAAKVSHCNINSQSEYQTISTERFELQFN